MPSLSPCWLKVSEVLLVQMLARGTRCACSARPLRGRWLEEAEVRVPLPRPHERPHTELARRQGQDHQIIYCNRTCAQWAGPGCK